MAEEEEGGAVADLGGLLNAVPDAVLALGDDGEVLFANETASALFSDLSLKFELPPIGLGQPDVVEVEVERGDETRLTEMRQARATWRGEPVHLVMLRDVTEQRRLAARVQQNERLALIGRIAAEVAHEINNPASFIQVNLELLREDLLDGPQRSPEEVASLIDESLAGVCRVADIVNDLRRFSNPQTEDVEDVDLSAVVRDACKILGPKLRSGADLALDLQAVPSVAARRGKLLQVVTNLVVNALQAVEGHAFNQRRVRVSTRAVRNVVQVSVEDNGIGMTPRVRARALDPFFTTKGVERGTGLGLAICAEIVRAHGGDIRITSQQGEGTRVDIEIPLQTGLVRVDVEDEATVAGGRARTRARVLIVDDEVSLLDSYRRVLEPQFHVQTAADGIEALEALREGPEFDVVLCDLMMPRLDGPALFETVRKELPQYVGRFLFATGGALTRRSAAFAAGDDVEVLHKPFSVRALRAAVLRVALSRVPSATATAASRPMRLVRRR